MLFVFCYKIPFLKISATKTSKTQVKNIIKWPKSRQSYSFSQIKNMNQKKKKIEFELDKETQMHINPKFTKQRKENKVVRHPNLLAGRDHDKGTFQAKTLCYAEADSLSRSGHNRYLSLKSFCNLIIIFLHFYEVDYRDETPETDLTFFFYFFLKGTKEVDFRSSYVRQGTRHPWPLSTHRMFIDKYLHWDFHRRFWN